MDFIEEEKGQIGPFEDLFELIVIVVLIFVFSATVAYSYTEYDEKREPIERFSAGLEFAGVLKNNILCVRVEGVPNPGLIDEESIIEKGNFVYLSRYWNKPYEWEVVIRGMSGAPLYEFGSLSNGIDSTRSSVMGSTSEKVSVVSIPIAYRTAEGEISPARMEVWVW